MLMTSSALIPSKVMCLGLLVVSALQFVSCQHDGQGDDKKNSEVEEGKNREDGKKRDVGQVHLDVILIRRPLPLLINKILVVLARSSPLE